MKRMIDSEVSERIKYRWDDDVEQSYIDIETNNLNVPGYINSIGLSTSSSIEPASISMEINGNYNSMNGGQIGNIPLYYHCVKLTSATKTAYVNLYSPEVTKCTSIIEFLLLIKGGQSNASAEFYYGAGDSVVHFYRDSTGSHCMIDNEEVTGYEDHSFSVFPDRYVVVR